MICACVCAIFSPCECCSAASGDWVPYSVLCTLTLPDGSTQDEGRTLFIYEISQCECQPCSSAYIKCLPYLTTTARVTGPLLSDWFRALALSVVIAYHQNLAQLEGMVVWTLEDA